MKLLFFLNNYYCEQIDLYTTSVKIYTVETRKMKILCKS